MVMKCFLTFGCVVFQEVVGLRPEVKSEIKQENICDAPPRGAKKEEEEEKPDAPPVNHVVGIPAHVDHAAFQTLVTHGFFRSECSVCAEGQCLYQKKLRTPKNGDNVTKLINDANICDFLKKFLKLEYTTVYSKMSIAEISSLDIPAHKIEYYKRLGHGKPSVVPQHILEKYRYYRSHRRGLYSQYFTYHGLFQGECSTCVGSQCEYQKMMRHFSSEQLVQSFLDAANISDLHKKYLKREYLHCDCTLSLEEIDSLSSRIPSAKRDFLKHSMHKLPVPASSQQQCAEYARQLNNGWFSYAQAHGFFQGECSKCPIGTCPYQKQFRRNSETIRRWISVVNVSALQKKYLRFEYLYQNHITLTGPEIQSLDISPEKREYLMHLFGLHQSDLSNPKVAFFAQQRREHYNGLSPAERARVDAVISQARADAPPGVFLPYRESTPFQAATGSNSRKRAHDQMSTANDSTHLHESLHTAVQHLANAEIEITRQPHLSSLLPELRSIRRKIEALQSTLRDKLVDGSREAEA